MTDGVMPDIRLIYKGEAPSPVPLPSGIGVGAELQTLTGSVWHVWALLYNGESWREFRNKGGGPGESQAKILAATRVFMESDYEVLAWHPVDRADGGVEWRADLGASHDE